jgi:hypothetical protein
LFDREQSTDTEIHGMPLPSGDREPATAANDTSASSVKKKHPTETISETPSGIMHILESMLLLGVGGRKEESRHRF